MMSASANISLSPSINRQRATAEGTSLYPEKRFVKETKLGTELAAVAAVSG